MSTIWFRSQHVNIHPKETSFQWVINGCTDRDRSIFGTSRSYIISAHTCQGYPGYFREPCIGLPEISRVTWQLCECMILICVFFPVEWMLQTLTMVDDVGWKISRTPCVNVWCQARPRVEPTSTCLSAHAASRDTRVRYWWLCPRLWYLQCINSFWHCRVNIQALGVNTMPADALAPKVPRARFQKRSDHCEKVIGSLISRQLTISRSDRIPRTILLRSDHDPGRSCSRLGSVLDQKFHHNNWSFYQ